MANGNPPSISDERLEELGIEPEKFRQKSVEGKMAFLWDKVADSVAEQRESVPEEEQEYLEEIEGKIRTISKLTELSDLTGEVDE